jgi:hypothetical protein
MSSPHRANRDLFLAPQMPDPGNAGSIVVTKNTASLALVSTAAETRTLARPSRSGAILNLHMMTDGGDITLTVTGGYNDAGDTSYVFSTAGQSVTFVSIADSTTTFVWRALADSSVSLGSNSIVAITPSSSATLSITAAAHHGKTIYVTKTDGWNATLPTPVVGMKFRIVLGATIATASTIKSVSGAHIMIGNALMGNDTDNTTVLWQAVAASTFDTIDLLGTANSTGGIAGQEITIEAMSSTLWFVRIVGDAAGTEATPFANTVA